MRWYATFCEHAPYIYTFFDLFCPIQVNVPTWFTVDTRLGSLSVHLDTPQCFSAEMYSADLGIAGKPEDDKVFFSHTYIYITC